MTNVLEGAVDIAGAPPEAQPAVLAARSAAGDQIEEGDQMGARGDDDNEDDLEQDQEARRRRKGNLIFYGGIFAVVSIAGGLIAMTLGVFEGSRRQNFAGGFAGAAPPAAYAQQQVAYPQPPQQYGVPGSQPTPQAYGGYPSQQSDQRYLDRYAIAGQPDANAMAVRPEVGGSPVPVPGALPGQPQYGRQDGQPVQVQQRQTVPAAPMPVQNNGQQVPARLEAPVVAVPGPGALGVPEHVSTKPSASTAATSPALDELALYMQEMAGQLQQLNGRMDDLTARLTQVTEKLSERSAAGEQQLGAAVAALTEATKALTEARASESRSAARSAAVSKKVDKGSSSEPVEPRRAQTATAEVRTSPAPAPLRQPGPALSESDKLNQQVYQQLVLRGVTQSGAWVSEGASGKPRAVGVGETLPGIGTVRSIHQENGTWVVEGSAGRLVR